jgi:hypothetical protein
MWMTLAFVAALGSVPAQPGQLALTHARLTYGALGAPRPTNKFLPGDSFVLAFDIEGIKADANGKVLYSMGMEVTDQSGKVHFKQVPRDLETVMSLGGSSLPAYASVHVGFDQEPGTYTVKVTVTDRAAKSSKSVTMSGELLPRAFGLVRPVISGDPEGKTPAPFPSEGQPVWINFSAVGFGRDTSGKTNLNVSLRVLDENGKPTLAKPFVGVVNDDTPKTVQAVPMQFALDLNRAGKFTLQLEAADKASGKTATLSLPLTVLKNK